LADGLKTSISTNRQNGRCFATGTTATDEDKLTGKYGKATILQGTATATPPNSSSLTCGIHYEFNGTGVSDKLKGKEIVLKVTEDSVLKLENMASKTTSIDKKYLPSAFR
ncbi:pilin, partial [Moraxella nonliquefaciens]|uniref:pilin n=1 Tax=Moraxella nonliquefaciens TaxID=478 RepID=UPI00081D9A0E